MFSRRQPKNGNLPACGFGEGRTIARHQNKKNPFTKYRASEH